MFYFQLVVQSGFFLCRLRQSDKAEANVDFDHYPSLPSQ